MSAATTQPPFSRMPTEVLQWTQLLTQAASRNYSTSRVFRSEDVHFNPHLILSNEESVSSALDTNDFEVLSRLLPNRIGAHSEIDVVGNPGRIYYQYPARDARLVIEIKTNRILSCDDLAAKFMEDIDLVTRRMALTRYGILTTYHKTWFVKRDTGTLWISPTIHHDSTAPTLLQCYMFFIGLVDKEGQESPSAPPSSPPDPNDGDDGDNGDKDGSSDSNDGVPKGRKQPTKKYGQKLSNIVTRSKNKVQQSLKFTSKHPEYEEEMLTEVAVYEALKELQGTCIPRVKAAGYDGFIFVIAMENVGSPLEVDTLNHDERLKIVENLSQIHQLGIIHNDIRPQNILICRNGGGFQVRFIDFALSKPTSDKRMLKKEATKLKNLLWRSGRD
ncbi:hypothetical protein BG004_003689 [Podila humilis]|nr:hypothetical protein BG004_003689 [Podila humilis]